MPDAMTTTGAAELMAATNGLPAKFHRTLMAVGRATGGRMQRRAQALIPRGTGASAAAIVVVEDPANNEVRVESRPGRRRPGNLPLWLEYGTGPAGRAKGGGGVPKSTQAFQYMARSALGEQARYARDVRQVLQTLLNETFR